MLNLKKEMKDYNSLTDIHLTEFLSQNNRREILIRNGLLSEDGFIICRPNDFLTKRDVYKNILNLPENTIRVDGKFSQQIPKSPYSSTVYKDYKEKLFKIMEHNYENKNELNTC